MKRAMAAFMLILAAQPVAAQDDVTGPAVVIDGDTLRVGTTRIQLLGVDAPDRGEPFGTMAMQVLRAAVDGGEVSCKPLYQDPWRDTVATCATHGVADLGAHLIRKGAAWHRRRYTCEDGRVDVDWCTRYAIAEARAMEARRGVWVGFGGL